jgi:hypothetical protein
MTMSGYILAQMKGIVAQGAKRIASDNNNNNYFPDLDLDSALLLFCNYLICDVLCEIGLYTIRSSTYQT